MQKVYHTGAADGLRRKFDMGSGSNFCFQRADTRYSLCILRAAICTTERLNANH